jgi:DNA repair exonuclease SbcCD ATPase subunit
MPDDIERRLTAAAQALREFEVCGQRCELLHQREQAVTAELNSARQDYSGEQKDVTRLEGLSLTHVIASLHGSRDDALAREKAQAQAAQYKAADSESRLSAVRDELAQAERRQRDLAGAPQAYADVMAEKEEHLTHSSDPRGAQLLTLASERGRLTAEVAELNHARQAAESADQALAEVQDRLGSASSWSTYDTVFGGGMIGNAVKHDRMDEAARAAAEADRRLARLRTDLTDIREVEPTAPRLEVSGGLRFADIFFNSIFTDLAVASHIRQAQDNASAAVQHVRDIRSRLDAQDSAAQDRLAAIESERQSLLGGS